VSDQARAVEAYQNAMSRPGDATAAALAALLSDDVVVQTGFGKAEGVDAALALLREPRMAGLLAAGAQWSPPSADGGRSTVRWTTRRRS